MSLPRAVVGDAYTSTHAWEVLEDLVEIGNRMAGQGGEREGAEVVRDAFEAAGLREARIEEFEIPGWWRGSTELTVEAGRTHTYGGTHQVIALPGTPAGEVEAGLVDVGHGLPGNFEGADLDGQVAMASSLTPDDAERWVHRGEKYGMAAEAGAVGFLFRNHVEGCLPPTGSVGSEDGPGPIPAAGVSKELGDRLVRYCGDGSVEARLEIDCRNGPSRSRNTEAVVGPDTDEEVLVTAHVDAHDIAEGANDNGTGTALVCEVGRLLALVEDDLGTRVRCLVVGAEEVGLFGARHYAESRDLDRVKCVVNMDGIGYSRDLDVYTHGFDPLGDAFHETAEELSIPIEVSDDVRPFSDHWPFVCRGVPGVQARSMSGESGRGWGHTHGDTLDKLDLRDVRDLAVGVASAVYKLAEADRTVEHKPASEIREATIEEGYEEGLRAGDMWPFEE